MSERPLMPGTVHRQIPATVDAPKGLLGVRLRALWHARRLRPTFEGVERYCMFVGYPRSGHTLIGALLNAHPEMLIAHELDALAYIQAGFTQRQLFAMLVDRDCAYSKEGRAWQGYDYNVPRQWQGRFQRLRVIGDKKGGRSSMRLGAHWELLAKLRRVIKLPLRMIHEVRNPYDNIATLFNRKRLPTLEGCAGLYFELLATNDRISREMPGDQFLTVRHEDFVARPAESLKQLCAFIGVAATDDYLSDCASVVFESPRKTRDSVEWPADLRSRIDEQIARYPFLNGYRFED